MWTYAAFTTAAACGPPRRVPPRVLAGAGFAPGCCARGESGDAAGGRVSGLPGRQLLDTRHLRAAGPPAQQAVALAHVDRRVTCTPTSARRTATGPTTASRSPSSAATTRRCGCASTTPSESDRVRYPLGARHPDRGRPRLRRRPARDRRRQGHAAGSTRPANTRSARRPLARRLRRGLVADAATRCGPTAGPPPTPPGCRSCPGCCAGTRCKHGDIDHAIRFTTDVTSRHHLWPARHDAGSQRSLAYPPMGARFRLQASLPDPPGFGADARRRWSRR